MRVALVVVAALVAVASAHSDADETYAAALADLRSLVDDAIAPLDAASTQSSWTHTAAAWAEHLGLDRVGARLRTQARDHKHSQYDNTASSTSLMGRIAAWLDPRPKLTREREPFTVYDTPERALWPDWDYDHVKASRAHARRNVPFAINGWEQAMWGPFVADIQDPQPPLVQTAADAFHATQHGALIAEWITNQMRRFVRSAAPHDAPRSAAASQAAQAAVAKRDRAIAMLEQVAFRDVYDEEAMLASTFRDENVSTTQADALWVLGEHSLWGTHGAAPDLPRALRAFTQLAQLGNASAHARLGFLYDSPLTDVLHGVPQHAPRALMHHVFAAQEGDYGAQLALAHRYAHGLGVPVDCLEALRWYDAAAQATYAQYLAGPPGGRTLPYTKVRLGDRAILASKLSPRLHAGRLNPLLSVKLLRSGVRHLLAHEPRALSDTAALHDILDVYQHHQGSNELVRLLFLAHAFYRGSVVGEGEALGAVERNFPLAMHYARYVAEKRWPMPAELENAAWPARRPDGGLQRAYQAVEMSEADTVRTGDAAALLGMMYLRGEGTPQDYERAQVWLTRAQLDGNRRAAAWLAIMYDEGWTAPANPELAQEILNDALRKEYAPDAAVEMARKLIESKLSEEALKHLPRIAYLGAEGEGVGESGQLETSYEVSYLRGSVYADQLLAHTASVLACNIGADELKRAAERADWDDPVYHRAETAFSRGDIATALMGWAISASYGVEEAQDNVAFVLDPIKSLLRPAPPRGSDRAALQYWAESALQGSRHALERVCDYVRLARGTDAGQGDAASCYMALIDVEKDLAAPYWYLAQIYENGAGTTTRDFPLAKRYYDVVTGLAPGKAILTTFPALVRLHLKAVWLWLHGNDSARRLLASYMWKPRTKRAPSPARPRATPADMDVWLDYAVDAAVFGVGLVLLGMLYLLRRWIDVRLQAANAQLAQIQALR
ncbi:ERAD-associated protein [Malassezia brasiliensis]|uniref:ERAD-associated protein n=1 Tax=Malassezia brasiliensis TaxID=1821822 RepID=A0AAF0DXQ8_9BASI|nr:ERAD-associated protein [Malassezia brasiliensis]